MNLTDHMEKGFLTVYKEFPDGSREYVIKDEPNTITMKSRRAHLRYLFDYDNAPKDQIESFKVGNGGAVGDDTAGNNNVRVLTPDPTRNDLYSPITMPNRTITMVPSDESDNTQVYLQINFSLSQDSANGMKINECGLFKSSGDMFNHKTFNNVEKSEAFSLIFSWKLRYV